MTETIRFDGVTITYADASAPALCEVDLSIDEGELVLVVGRTGSGKSTFLGAINGTVPHFTGGHLSGRVAVCGKETRDHRPRDLADVVGVVGQDPLAGFVTDTVEEELAYGMEQLALPPDVMRRRVEETLDLLGIAHLRHAPLHELSGGEQQRVAIGSVLATHPQVLVLDEPTSSLDPAGADEVLAAISRLVHDTGLTVVVAEHRIERVVHHADRIVHVGVDGQVRIGDPAEIMADADVAPPIVELGRLAGWSPLPLSVREARRRATDLRDSLAAAIPHHRNRNETHAGSAAATHALAASGIVVTHGDVHAVRAVDLTLRGGEVAALMGRNGAGKSSLLWALQGTGTRSSGRVELLGSRDPADLSPADRRRAVGLVPQTPSDLLYLDTVDAECRQADHESGAPPGTCAGHLDRLAPGIPRNRHPRDLSEGQRLALVLAIQLTADPAVLLLDEPTRGLDYSGKHALADGLRELADAGRSVLLSTHDVEFVASVADRVVVLAEGELVADGPTRDVVLGSPAYAPQVAKVLAPQPWLTVAEIGSALTEGAR